MLPGLGCSGTCSAVVALLQAQEVLEKCVLGSWGRSLHHSGEVHSLLEFLSGHFDDKHVTKIQAFIIIIFLAVICYNIVVKDEY